MKTDWNNIYKIRIRELTEAQTKHLIVKTLIVQQLLIKYSKIKNYLRIYTEFPITEGKVCDIYFENIKKKECYAYEIQSNITSKWIEETKELYKDWEMPFMKTSNWILIDLKKLSDNIPELIKQVNNLII